jgi:SAM-dependent methyltransferase
MEKHSLNFNRQAREYQEEAYIQRETALYAAEFIEKDLTGKTIHEFGAGTGFFTRYLIQKGDLVHATDGAEDMVQFGKQIYPEAKWSIMDAWNPPAFDPVDRIYSTSLLQWAPEPVETLKNWRLELKSGGKSLHAIYAEKTLSEFFEFLPDSPFINFRTVRQWKAIFLEAGFTQVKTSVKTVSYEFDSPFALLRNLHRIGVNGSSRLNLSQINQLFSLYRAKYSLPNGKIYSTWTTCVVEAENG